MAPQANRRTGFSRRAQYTTFFSYVAGAVGVLVGAAFLIFAIYSPSSFGSLRSFASDAAAPAARVSTGGRVETQGFIDAIAGYFAAGRKNARLQREAQIAQVKLIEARATAEENRRLKALLGLMDDDPHPVTTARLIGSTSSSVRRFATISAGSSDGVMIGMPVRSPLGLIGRVLEVGRNTARVLLVTDTESVVPVRRASDGIAAFATGRTDGTLQLRLINLGINPLRKGDTFVTSGSGGLYRPGTAIAIVVQTTRDGAIARVLSDPGATEFVVVEPIWAPAVEPEPALPAPTPTASQSPAP